MTPFATNQPLFFPKNTASASSRRIAAAVAATAPPSAAGDTPDLQAQDPGEGEVEIGARAEHEAFAGRPYEARQYTLASLLAPQVANINADKKENQRAQHLPPSRAFKIVKNPDSTTAPPALSSIK